MVTSNDSSATILLVEDNTGDVRLCQEAFVNSGHVDWALHVVGTLGDALERLRRNDIDVVLLDLGLPDSSGIETLTQIQSEFPILPIIVLTGRNDEDQGAEALRRGAQDYLFKTDVWTTDIGVSLLRRAVRYAIERAQLHLDLQAAREREREFRETSGLQRLGNPGPVSQTARAFGIKPLKEVAPKFFAEFGARYRDVLDQALEYESLQGVRGISGELQKLAQDLADLRSGPRDVIDLHVTTIVRQREEASADRVNAQIEVGRFVVLELMGMLADHYRNLTGFLGRPPVEPFQGRNPEDGRSEP